MKCKCLRCDHVWESRSDLPTRCPMCKSTKWNKEQIEHYCYRCGFRWNQRGTAVPRYCPSCHSYVWMRKKVVYLCPRCGRSRTLRSNSRGQMCPYCDGYDASRQDEVKTSRDMSPYQTVYCDPDYSKIVYYQPDTEKIVLYLRGDYVSSAPVSAWSLASGHQPPDIHRAQESPGIAASLLEFLDGCRPDGGADRNDDIRRMSRLGASPVSISLSLGIAYSDVMDVLKKRVGPAGIEPAASAL